MNADEKAAVCGDCGMPGECAACFLMRSQGLTPPNAQKVATDAQDRPGATNSPEVAGSQAAHTDAHEAPDSLGVQDRAGLGEVGA